MRRRLVSDEWDWQKLTLVARREAQRVLPNRHDAEDAAQNAIIRAYRAHGRCQTPQAPDGWIRSIARREAIRLASAVGERDQLVDNVPDQGTPDPVQLVLDRVAARAILARVPAGDRGLLVRRYLLDQTSREIAADVVLPAATVRVRLHRAVKRLHEHEHELGHDGHSGHPPDSQVVPREIGLARAVDERLGKTRVSRAR